MSFKSQLNTCPHPGPLPQERENCFQSDGEAGVVRYFDQQSLLFPLPGGEGQGEGGLGLYLPFINP